MGQTCQEHLPVGQGLESRGLLGGLIVAKTAPGCGTPRPGAGKTLPRVPVRRRWGSLHHRCLRGGERNPRKASMARGPTSTAHNARSPGAPPPAVGGAHPGDGLPGCPPSSEAAWAGADAGVGGTVVGAGGTVVGVGSAVAVGVAGVTAGVAAGAGSVGVGVGDGSGVGVGVCLSWRRGFTSSGGGRGAKPRVLRERVTVP